MNQISRQRKWQIKKEAEGRCRQCGGQRSNKSIVLCSRCSKKNNELTMERALRLKNAMRCSRCGAARDCESTWLCFSCLTANRKAVRKNAGYKLWKPGSRGRPPIIKHSPLTPPTPAGE